MTQQKSEKRAKPILNVEADPSMIQEWSDHETVSPQRDVLAGPGTFYIKKYSGFPQYILHVSDSPSGTPVTKSSTWTSPTIAHTGPILGQWQKLTLALHKI